jgi:hypothetical protein
MAGERGVRPADREAFVSGLTAVLDRDPASVHATQSSLRRTRDHAASIEAFELAARVQAELRGLMWVTSTQR